MGPDSKLVIVGDGEFAAIAHEYFLNDSAYQVVAFAVESAFLHRNAYRGLPVVALEDVQNLYPPSDHAAFVAVTYTQLNRVRARLFRLTKSKGYRLATYVSSRAFVWSNVTLGENVFIFESNVLQHMVSVGDDVILWSGNHVGHRSTVQDHCYVASHVVISGYCTVGENSFLGVNSTLADRVNVGRDCFIGAGALILADTAPGTVYRGVGAEPARVGSLRFMKVKEQPDPA